MDDGIRLSDWDALSRSVHIVALNHATAAHTFETTASNLSRLTATTSSASNAARHGAPTMNLPNALPVQSRVHARLGSNDIGNGRIVDIDQRNRPVEDWLYTVLLDSPGENQSRYTAFYRDELTLLAAPNTTHALWTTP